MNKHFFIPDFIDPQTLLNLMILIELLITVLILADGGAAFDWYRFCMVTLFVFCIVFTSIFLISICAEILHSIKTSIAYILVTAIVVVCTLVATSITIHTSFIMHIQEQYSNDLYWRNSLIAIILCFLTLRYLYIYNLWNMKKQAALFSQIESLQARMRPHFLFNSLNSIATLVHIDPLKAENALLDLSDLFRATLSNSNTISTLKEEVDLAKKYISIETHRFEDKLRIEWDISAPNNTPIPNLTIQPLVENAVVHGVSQMVNGGKIIVKSWFNRNRFYLSVTNDFRGSTNKHGAGHAIGNLEFRLRALFGDSSTFKQERTEDTYTVIISYSLSTRDVLDLTLEDD